MMALPRDALARAPARLVELGLAGAMLALFVFANARAPLPNDDGVLYLVVAQRIAQDGLTAGFELFDRPWYSALIAWMHTLSGLSLLWSARVLNGACALLLALAFVRFARALHADQRMLPWAALLLLAHPKLANWLAFVVRDIGYWAFLFASFAVLMRFAASFALRVLPLWAACVLCAALFKPEAVAFGLLPPLGLLLVREQPVRRRVAATALAWACVLLPIGVAAARFAARAAPDPAMSMLELPAAVAAGFGAAVERYADTVLDPFSRHVAALSLAGGLAVLLVAKLANALGVLQILVLFAGRGRAGPAGPAQRTMFRALMATALLLPALFVAYRQFLDTRYVMVPVLLLLALAAPRLAWLFEWLCARLRPALVVALFAAAFALDLGLGLDKPKPYMLECVAWLRGNVPEGVRVFSNDPQLAVASGAAWDWPEVRDAEQLLAEGRAPRAGVAWAIHLRHDRSAVADPVAAWGAQPAHVFANERGDRILVFVPDQPRLK